MSCRVLMVEIPQWLSKTKNSKLHYKIKWYYKRETDFSAYRSEFFRFRPKTITVRKYWTKSSFSSPKKKTPNYYTVENEFETNLIFQPIPILPLCPVPTAEK